MATEKKDKKSEVENETSTDSLWRKPITLDSFEEEDPLAQLYQGGKVEDKSINAKDSFEKAKKNATKSAGRKSKNSEK